MEKSLFRYIWRHSRRDQLIICAVVLASLPFYFASLDLPRRIVNEAIQGRAFEGGRTTAPFLAISFDLPRWLGGGTSFTSSSGFQVDRCRPAVRPVGAVPGVRPDQRRLQVLDQRRQGRARRAHAAADALRPFRPGPALHARGAAHGEVVRDGDDHQGRGRADRRLHRRCLHHAGLPRHAGDDGAWSSSWCRTSGSASWRSRVDRHSVHRHPAAAPRTAAARQAAPDRVARARRAGSARSWTASRRCTSTTPSAGSGPRSASGSTSSSTCASASTSGSSWSSS